MLKVLQKSWWRLTALVLQFFPAVVYAADPGCDTANSALFKGTCLPNRAIAPWDNVDTFSGAVTVILNTLLLVVGLVAVIYVVYGGYRYITGGEDEEKVKQAKNTITNALIGVVLVLIALALVRIIANAVSGSV